MKTLDDYFTDWEGEAFGFGYGTGEPYIIPALKRFLELCPFQAGTYDHSAIENAVTPTVAWLLINRLAQLDIIEYGTSPRFGWLTEKGKRLKQFTNGRSADDLISLTCRWGDYVHCYPTACNCGSNGYEKGRVCQNPFWLESALSSGEPAR